jgi:hypothetical protein
MAGGIRTGAPIANSCRFNDGDTPYMARTPSVDGDQRQFTLSTWVKRGTLGTIQGIMSGDQSGAGTIALLRFSAQDTIELVNTGAAAQLETAAVYRDPSAWYHIVFAVDTDQVTAADRNKLYVNGTQVTWTGTDYVLNVDVRVNRNTESYELRIGQATGGTSMDGYLAETHFIDGTQYAATDFGEFNVQGNWIPR